MKSEEIDMLIKLREYVIGAYKSLDGGEVNTSIVKQEDVATTLESVIRSIDDILRNYVKFE